MDIEKLLQNRDTAMLEWAEPWPAVTSTGKYVHAEIFQRVTVNDCINMARYAAITTHGVNLDDPRLQDEAALLNEFIAIQWAHVVDE